MNPVPSNSASHPANCQLGPAFDAGEDPGVQRLSSQNTLEPGQYWRVTKPHTVPDPEGRAHYAVGLHEGDLHLITKLFDFEGTLHSVSFLEHPRDARKDRFDTLVLLTADFLAVFEPVQMAEAKAQRMREQAEVMDQIAQVQDEMRQAQENPLSLPEVQEAAQKAAERFEAQEVNRVQAEVKDVERRAADLRRLHRRAARRSEAKGNPLAVRTVTISDRLDVMLSEGVSSDGVRELQMEAGRRLAVATAASEWLTERSRRMSTILERVTPYLAEQGQLALAGASSAISRVGEIERGIQSLKLYTGDGVDVVPVREGRDAPTDCPLTLIQQKLAMDEELAVYADVEDNFDCASRELFFQRLSTDDALLNQILPLPRCVVSVQTTRRLISYGPEVHPYEALMRELENKRVFLLVRNGENVHAVYSCEPSHEAATRLFPNAADLKAPFCGLDGASIGLQDVAFGKASKRFEDQALHYRRFLILLCGLDHRLGLFGEFFPPSERPAFMSLAFQECYFRFLQNDDPALLLGGDHETVLAWIGRHNAMARSGSRIVLDAGMVLNEVVAHVRRSSVARIDRAAVRENALIAAEKKGALVVSVPTYRVDTDARGSANLPLHSPGDSDSSVKRWFLCIDQVDLADVRRFIYDRQQRIASISWLRTLRRVEQVLQADAEAQAPLRQYLRESALAAKVQTAESVDAAVNAAISTWRADHRGAPTPALSDTTALAQLLSLVYPTESLADTLRGMAEDLAERESIQPLMLARTGTNQLVLYSVVPESERAAYSPCMKWGWVRRHILKVTRARGEAKERARLGSASYVWLQAKAMGLSESAVIEWPALPEWVHELPEPLRLSELAKLGDAIAQGQTLMTLFKACRTNGSRIPDELAAEWLSTLCSMAASLRYNQTPFITVVLGAYQLHADRSPDLVCARVNYLHLLRVLGTPEQMSALLNTRGFRAPSTREDANQCGVSLPWYPVVLPYLPKGLFDLSGSINTSRNGYWYKLETHYPGGESRSNLRSAFHSGTTRVQRRDQGGKPHHRKTVATLSWSRAIDSLMGIQPLQRKAFYASRAERVSRIWSGLSDDTVPLEDRRKQEANRTFEPKLPLAIHLAPCLWDADKGRSMANSFLSQPKVAPPIAPTKETP